MLLLGLMAEGERGEIVAGRRAGRVDDRAEELGLRAGNVVTVLRNSAGPLLVKVEESRIALDRAIAMRIEVRRKTE